MRMVDTTYHAPLLPAWHQSVKWGGCVFALGLSVGPLLLVKNDLWEISFAIANLLLTVVTATFVAACAWSDAAGVADHKTVVEFDGESLHIRRKRYHRPANSLRKVFSKPILERVSSSLDVHIPVEDCRYFEGYSFHDPLFKNLDSWRGLVLSWPPYDDQHRVAFAFSARKREEWQEVFERLGIPRDTSRMRRERGIFLAAIVLGGAIATGLTALAMSAIANVANIPGDSMRIVVPAVVAFVWGAFLARLIARGTFGDYVGHRPLGEWMAPAFGITVLMVLPLLSKRNGAHVDAVVTAVIVGALFGGIIWIVHRRFREREIRQLGTSPDAVEPES